MHCDDDLYKRHKQSTRFTAWRFGPHVMQGILQKVLKRGIYTDAEYSAISRVPAKAKCHFMPVVARATVAGDGLNENTEPHI